MSLASVILHDKVCTVLSDGVAFVLREADMFTGLACSHKEYHETRK